jgi:hypothetical protein
MVNQELFRIAKPKKQEGCVKCNAFDHENQIDIFPEEFILISITRNDKVTSFFNY